jgi:glycosyltransferase involved in cell wall biosynthesis
MRAVCIVNNYNYERFLPACLDSITAQTRAFDLVLIVDDGSTDGSRAIIRDYVTRFPHFKPIFKANGGQLSCFNAVVGEIQATDAVTFIDSDDIYPRNYLETILERHSKRLASLYFCEQTEFTELTPDILAECQQAGGNDFLLPCTSALTRARQCWIGSPTTGISLTGKLYLALFPYPHEADWITRADDIIVYGTSLLGMSKLYIPGVRFGYRVHGSNHYFGRPKDPADRVIRKHRLEKLFGWYCDIQKISTTASGRACYDEQALIPRTLWQRFHLPDPVIFLPKRGRLLTRVKRVAKRILGKS